MDPEVRYMSVVHDLRTGETYPANGPTFCGHRIKKRAVIDTDKYNREEREAAAAEQRPLYVQFFVVKATTTFKTEN